MSELDLDAIEARTKTFKDKEGVWSGTTCHCSDVTDLVAEVRRVREENEIARERFAEVDGILCQTCDGAGFVHHEGDSTTGDWRDYVATESFDICEDCHGFGLCQKPRAVLDLEEERDQLRADLNSLRGELATIFGIVKPRGDETANAAILRNIATALNAEWVESDALRAENERLRKAMKALADVFHDAWMDHGYDAEDLGPEYEEARYALAATEKEQIK